MIGIIASIDEELEFIKNKLDNLEVKNIKGNDFFTGKINNLDIVITICHTGKVHAAMTAQKLIDLFSPTLIINCGVAGGIGKNLNIGDVIIMTDTLQTDMDASLLGYKKGEIPDINMLYFEQDKKFNDIAKNMNKNYSFNTYYGRILTADKFVADKDEQTYLEKEYSALCTDMETAAFAQTCYVNNINFAGIRGISDTADADAGADFRKNLNKASDNCAMVLYDILKEYS